MKTRQPRKKTRWVLRNIALVLILAICVFVVFAAQPSAPLSTNPQDAGRDRPFDFSLGQIIAMFVASMAVMANLAQLSGWSLRDMFGVRVDRLPLTQPKQPSFWVPNSIEELEDLLLPDTQSPLIPDRHVPYLKRELDYPDAAFEEGQSVLFVGLSKTGKTREMIELLRRCWHLHQPIVVAKHNVNLNEFILPDRVPRDFTVVVDDVSKYFDTDSLSFQIQRFHTQLTEIAHGRIQIVGTIRAEEGPLDIRNELDGDRHQYCVIDVPSLSGEESAACVEALAKFTRIQIDSNTRDEIAKRNDGTFLNIVLSFRSWASQGVALVGQSELENFSKNLESSWQVRFQYWTKRESATPAVYAAIDFLAGLGEALDEDKIFGIALLFSQPKWGLVIQGAFRQLDDWLWQKYPLAGSIFGRSGLLQGAIWCCLFLFVPGLVLGGFYWESIPWAGAHISLLYQLYFGLFFLAYMGPLIIISYLRLRKSLSKKRIHRALQLLLRYEIPAVETTLRPYEGQTSDLGATASWPVGYFLAEQSSKIFRRTARFHVATIFVGLADPMPGDESEISSLSDIAERLLEDSPYVRYVRWRIAWALVNSSRYSEAIKWFRKARSASSSPTITYIRSLEFEGACQILQGDANSALELGDISVRHYPLDHYGWWVRGLARLQLNDTVNGLRDCCRGTWLQRFGRFGLPWFVHRAQEAGLPVPDITDGHIECCAHKTASIARRLFDAAIVALLIGMFGLFLAIDPRADWPTSRVSYYMDHLFGEEMTSFVTRVSLLRYPVLRSIYGDTVPVNIFHARSLTANKEYEAALSIYERLERDYPAESDIFYYRGNLYLELSNLDAAIADFGRLVALFPDDPVGFERRGWSYYLAGDYEHAANDLRKANAIDRSWVWPWRELCTVLSKSDTSSAVEACTRAIELAPTAADIYVSRAYLLSTLGNSESALEDLAVAESIDSKQYDIYVARSSVMRAMDKPDEARNTLRKLLDQFPDYRYSTYVYLGNLERDEGRPDDALTYYVNAISLDEVSAWAYKERAQALLHKRLLPEALNDADMAIAQDKTYPDAHYVRGLVLYELSKYPEAQREFELAIQGDQRNSNYLRALARTLYQLQQYEEALAQLDNAISTLPQSSSQLHAEKGRVLYRLKNYAQAVQEYTQALKIGGHQYYIYLFRADAYLMLGQYERAYTDIMAYYLNLDAAGESAERSTVELFRFLVYERLIAADRVEDAVQALTALGKLQPTLHIAPESEASRAKAVLLTRRGDLIHAYETLEAAVPLTATQVFSPAGEIAHAVISEVFRLWSSNRGEEAHKLLEQTASFTVPIGIDIALTEAIFHAQEALEKDDLARASKVLNSIETIDPNLQIDVDKIIVAHSLDAFAPVSAEVTLAAVLHDLASLRAFVPDTFVIPEAETELRQSRIAVDTADLAAAYRHIEEARKLDPFLANERRSALLRLYEMVASTGITSTQEVISATQQLAAIALDDSTGVSAAVPCLLLASSRNLPAEIEEIISPPCKHVTDNVPTLIIGTTEISRTTFHSFGELTRDYWTFGIAKLSAKAGDRYRISVLGDSRVPSDDILTLLSPKLERIGSNLLRRYGPYYEDLEGTYWAQLTGQDWFEVNYPLEAVMTESGDHLLLVSSMTDTPVFLPTYTLVVENLQPGQP